MKSIERSRVLVRAAIALMAAFVVASCIAIWLLREGAIKDTEADNHRLGVVLAEQTVRTFQAVDSVLQEIIDKIASGDVKDSKDLRDKLGGLDVHDALARRLVDLPQAEAFTIVDSTGHIANVTRQWPAPGYSLADRGYFRYFAATADSNAYISEPSVSISTGARTVFLARRLTAANGVFLGVVLAPIRLDYFDSFFAKTGFTDGTGISIIRRDGLVLTHFPDARIRTNQRLPSYLPWYQMAAAGGGHYRSSGAFDDLGPTFVSVHPAATYPIVVDVARSQVAALGRWRQQTGAIGLGILVAMISLALLLRAFARQIRLIEISKSQISEQMTIIQASEARLAVQSMLLETTLEHIDQGLLMVDAQGNVAMYNKRAIELLDLSPDMLAAHPHIMDVVEYQKAHGEFASWQDEPIDLAIFLSAEAVYERRRPDNTMLEVRSTPLPDGGFVRTYTDISGRVAAEEMLGRAASLDQLTGLANRISFNTKLEAALATAQRTNKDLAVLCLDLDRFKAINDTLGHHAGDQLLVEVAQRIRGIARATDILSRLGGDEFAIVLPGANLSGSEIVSQRLLEAIRAPYIIDGQPAHIGVSIGISVYPNDGATSEQLLRNADAALYKAKASGRNVWCAYVSEDGQREHQRLALELDLATAVALQQFQLVYQPICDTTTSRPVAFEALLRWNHPTRGLISPAEFIPLAEQTGTILPLGRWVIETACTEAATWAMPLRVAVNLSPVQFHDHDLTGFIQDVLSRTGLLATRLDLEVTEGLLLEQVEDVVKTMQALRAMGIRMVLDDFGTAHSSLSYLRGFPFDAVKIDRSFLRALHNDRQARALVEAMLGMARALGLDVVGEGVETTEQLALLNHLQCQYVQGYLLGRPMPAEETHARIWAFATDEVGAGRPLHIQTTAAGT